jgi:peptidoglycan/LPS O-acetylase OafA/YrhL
MTSVATSVADSTFLRRVLLVDATASGGMAVLFLLAAGALESLLGLPSTLLRGVGLFLIPFAAFLVWLAPRASERQAVVRFVAAGNVLWIVASVLLLVSGRVNPTPLGTGFVVLQALAVAIFAYLEDQRGQSRLIGFKRL